MRWLMAVAFALWAGAAYGETRDPDRYFLQPLLGDLRADLEVARAEGKTGVLLMFEMEDCPHCKRMKATVLNRPEVQDYFRQHFLIYPIDTLGALPLVDFNGRELTERAYTRAQGVRGTPAFLFFDLDGNRLFGLAGAIASVRDFLALGQYVVDGEFQRMSFQAYRNRTPREP